jgi:DNA-binding XRE family transcriptional regulator
VPQAASSFPDPFFLLTELYHLVVIITDYNQNRGKSMTRAEFSDYRRRLNKTQKQMAQLLGTSIKAVHSYEQGWRNIPPHVERQVFFLVSRMNNEGQKKKPCWVIKRCPASQKKTCPAWEFNSGDLCWFINGTVCEGQAHTHWRDKIKHCRTCDVFSQLMG